MKQELPRNTILIRKAFDWVSNHPYRFSSYLLFLFLLISVCYVPYEVDIGHVGVVRRFGHYTRTSDPGLHFRCPWGIDEVTIVDSQKIHRLALEVKRKEKIVGKEYFTGDENLVQLRCVLQYQIEEASNYLFFAEKPRQIVFSQLQEALVAICGSQSIDGILSEKKEKVEAMISSSLDKLVQFKNLGMKLISVNLDLVMPPDEALAAFIDVVDAKESIYEAQELAKTHKTESIAEAHGTSDRIISVAALVNGNLYPE